MSRFCSCCPRLRRGGSGLSTATSSPTGWTEDSREPSLNRGRKVGLLRFASLVFGNFAKCDVFRRLGRPTKPPHHRESPVQRLHATHHQVAGEHRRPIGAFCLRTRPAHADVPEGGGRGGWTLPSLFKVSCCAPPLCVHVLAVFHISYNILFSTCSVPCDISIPSALLISVLNRFFFFFLSFLLLSRG